MAGVRFNSQANARVSEITRADGQEAAFEAVRRYFAAQPRTSWKMLLLGIAQDPPRFKTQGGQSVINPRTTGQTLFMARGPDGAYTLSGGDRAHALAVVPRAIATSNASNARFELRQWQPAAGMSLDDTIKLLQSYTRTRNAVLAVVMSLDMGVKGEFLYDDRQLGRKVHREAVTAAAGDVIARRLQPAVLHSLYRPGGLGAERVRRHATDQGMRGRKRKRSSPKPSLRK